MSPIQFLESVNFRAVENEFEEAPEGMKIALTLLLREKDDVALKQAWYQFAISMEDIPAVTQCFIEAFLECYDKRDCSRAFEKSNNFLSSLLIGCPVYQYSYSSK